MIFVTVGDQMPFDRLVRTVDEWAARRGRTDVLAQIGEQGGIPHHIQWVRTLSPEEYTREVEESKAIIAHAGMGSVLAALEHRKPILVMPRQGKLRETRNDHQLAMARQLAELGYVRIARDESELTRRLDEVDSMEVPEQVVGASLGQLHEVLREFISHTPKRRRLLDRLSPIHRFSRSAEASS